MKMQQNISESSKNLEKASKVARKVCDSQWKWEWKCDN
jgi:hypothetical protein